MPDLNDTLYQLAVTLVRCCLKYSYAHELLYQIPRPSTV